ncbi:MAG TPA: hypothetical protein DCZ01_08360 [Elusimicrobia bacterium]|nr:MAG: hypothetical protein A2X37_10375 [Elusimicrobia bacterium GWA2_66_18]HAZ08515.1 hypothetical protein [Elusimicrobiota bacterium]
MTSFRIPKSVLFNRFTVQVAVSTVAVVLVQGNLPYLLQRAGLSAALLGTLYFLSRLGAIIGGMAGPWVLRRSSPHAASAAAEALNLTCCLVLYGAVLHSNAFLVAAAIAVRGLSTGFIPNVRVAWLKALPDQEIGRRVLIITRVIIQSSYGLIGVLLLLGVAQPLALALVLLDAATSAFAIPLFMSMRDFGVEVVAKPSADVMAFGFLFTRKNLPLLVGDLSLAVAMGGTNIFLVRAGDGLFRSAGGYGLSLVVYATAFLLGGFLVQARGGLLGMILRRSEPLAPWTMLTCLAILSWAGLATAWHAAAFFIMFLAYPIFLLTLETIWFRVTSQANIGPTFANRQMLTSLILAVGEVLYPHWTLGGELAIRLGTALIAALTYLLLIHERGAEREVCRG